MATNNLHLGRIMGVALVTATAPLHLCRQDRLYHRMVVEPADMATVIPMLQRRMPMPEVMEHLHLMVSLIFFIFIVKITEGELTMSQLQEAMVSVPTYHRCLHPTHTLPHRQLMADLLREDMVMALLRLEAAVTILIPPGGRCIDPRRTGVEGYVIL